MRHQSGSVGRRQRSKAMTEPLKLKAGAASYRMFFGCILLALTVTGAHTQQIAASPDNIGGKVEGGGGPIAKATVTLWAAGPGAPQKLAETQTKDDGSFDLASAGGKDDAGVLYLIAKGGEPKVGGDKGPNPTITLMATLGTTPPKRVTINELTTVASAWTGAQFMNGIAIKGPALGLRIAAGNVRNLVDLETGGLGPVIQDPLNSSQTATLATFSTLGDLLAGCITRVHGDACNKLFAAATPPAGVAPTDTLTAARNIARNPSHQAQQLFALLDAFYPVPAGKRLRAAPFIPYLSFAPGAWTLSLVYAGGGLNSLGGVAIDGEGNMWTGDNFLVGSQSTIFRGFGGGISKIAPNGRPISVFDRRTGKPLSPETGYNFGGQLGEMQGIITTPNGDVWALDNEKDQIVYLPKGDATKGRILGRTVNGKPVDGTLQVKAPFYLAVDQQDRIWVTNSGSDTVTRFPASDPGKAEQIKVGFAPRAIAIDSLGNAWINNTVGHPDTREKLALVEAKLKSKVEGLAGSGSKAENIAKMWIGLFETLQEFPGGDVSMVRPDGTVLPPFDGGKSILGPWGIAIDGNDNVWVANGSGHSVAQLCGARPANCPPGTKTGDAISPPGGYIGGLQFLTDLAIDPAGNIWVANNWDLAEQAGFKEMPPAALSTRFGGNGTVIFFGLAKPVRTPLIGP